MHYVTWNTGQCRVDKIIANFWSFILIQMQGDAMPLDWAYVKKKSMLPPYHDIAKFFT